MRGLLIAALLFCVANAGDLYLAGAMGYKKPIESLAASYQKASGVAVKTMFGNMQHIAAQTQNTDKFELFVGDEKIIDEQGVKYTQKIVFGEGVLTLVFSKSIKGEPSLDFLKNPTIKKIGAPHPKSAIFGIAADEALKNAKLYRDVESKLTIVQHIPQVAEYLKSGDIDAGFINKTNYLAIKDQTGFALEVDRKLYTPIKIVCVVLSERASEEAQGFIEFLKSAEAKEILKANGL
ncbi:MAG: molybdate ABC transporter substrate-binding protein [Helicobacteraceae bacterium]|jgi:molybdate transport system substrate-binding protein|nr:molybdate ABC transporter substrate-binding protein [Helicobacteraceae bacterium]